MYITTRKQLEQFIDRARVSEVLAVDTEFLREKTYWPKLCLIQMGTEKESVAIDPFAFDSLEPLKELFTNKKIVKLFHAASQDLEIIHHELGVLPEPIFDTQIAASLLGGAYLIYKGIDELRDVLALTEEKAEHSEEHKSLRQIGLAQAIATIMVMDVVFSIDSVITAVGLADHLIIMIMAVMIAIVVMMVFIDPISDFINKHAEMKILALVFISVIGVLLVLDSLGINSGIEVLDMHMEKLMVYFAMVFAVVLELIQMRHSTNLEMWNRERWQNMTGDAVKAELLSSKGRESGDSEGEKVEK